MASAFDEKASRMKRSIDAQRQRERESEREGKRERETPTSSPVREKRAKRRDFRSRLIVAARKCEEAACATHERDGR